MKRVLNVGGANRPFRCRPRTKDGSTFYSTSIPRGTPDLVCDARELTTLPPAQYDAVYCSHNLEHYYRHDVPRVLAGFRHVLNEDGFAEIRVPDLADFMQTVVRRGLDIDDLLYQSPAGPITVRDVLYGLGDGNRAQRKRLLGAQNRLHEEIVDGDARTLRLPHRLQRHRELRGRGVCLQTAPHRGDPTAPEFPALATLVSRRHVGIAGGLQELPGKVDPL